MDEEIKSRKILLFSGGIDSALIYEQYKETLTDFIYFDYGQPYLDDELVVAKKICPKLKVHKIRPKINISEDGYFEMRNLRFAIEARLIFPNEPLFLFVGTCKDDAFPDNNQTFFNALEEVLVSSYRKWSTMFVLPLKSMTKKEIRFAYASKNKKIKPYSHKG